jgi:hypothetical protein
MFKNANNIQKNINTMKAKKLFQKMLPIAAVLMLSTCLTTCRVFDDDTTYYDAEADGYVIYARTGEPVEGAIIGVRSGFASHGWATKQPVNERYYADSSGYYRLRFLKKVDGEKVTYNSVGVTPPNNPADYYIGWGMDSMGTAWSGVSPSALQEAKSTIRLDTARVYPKH